MSYTLTPQQEDIINTILSAASSGDALHPTVITVNAVAGASKSYTIQQAAAAFSKQNPTGVFRYLVFGALAATDARTEFGTSAIVSTVHALAYEYMIRRGHMRLLRNSNYLSWSDIPKHIKQPFGRTSEAFDIIADFCRDQSTDFKSFASETDVDYIMTAFCMQLLEAMYSGSMPCTHDIYLKCFHIDLVGGYISLEPVDILAADEVQDLSAIMLDLVKLYPAKVKVLVGDPYQSIFSFLGCVNAFHHFPKATRKLLTQSFRCSSEIAAKVQYFVRNTFDPDFTFVGYDYPTQVIKTRAYLTRTNNALIAKMIELNKSNTPYRLSTKSKLTQMFEWPLALLRIKPGGTETNPKFKSIQYAVNTWESTPYLKETSTKFQYLLKEFPENLDLASAVKLLVNPAFSPEDIINAYKHAKEHQTSNAPLSLLTTHTSKGSSFDEVELAPDMNESIADVMQFISAYRARGLSYDPTPEESEALYLYYVACSRARFRVLGATHL